MAVSEPYSESVQQTHSLRFVPSLYQVAILAILGAVLIVAAAPRLDTDMWWHLQVGKYILAHHAVPSHDYMTFSFRGHAWTDHEWLAEVAMYSLYMLAGLWGPIGAFALLICATFAIVYITIRQRGTHTVLALFITAAAFMASSASWGPRIQMVSLFFASVYALLLYRFEVTRNRRLLFAFPAIMLLWANIHAGFVLGLVILTITLAGEWLNRVTRREGAYSADDLKALAITLVATFAITVVNPNTYRQLLYPLTFVLPNAYTNLIQESASPNFHMPVMMVFEAMLLLLIAAFLVGRPRVNWTHLFMILAFTHLAFSQVRNVALWAVLIGPFVAYYLSATGPALQAEFPRFSYRRRPVQSRTGAMLNVVLLVLVLVAYTFEATHYINGTTMRQAETQNYPAGAIHYMKTHTLPRRVYVSYGWGGYLLWNLFPTYRDYMDSRADTLFNNAILRGYLSVYDAGSDWRKVVRKYGIQDILVERSAPIVQVLAHDHAWRLAYQDSMSALYVKG